MSMPLNRLAAASLVIRLAAAGLATLACAGCTGVRTLADPTLSIRTTRGSELGVSTEYGIVFLGRTAQAGKIEITVWFNDGPSVESAAIEPIGGGLYTAETEIRLPQVTMGFADARPGSDVVVIGRDADGLWERTVRVESDPSVEGMLLSIPDRLRNAPDQVGAGVYELVGGDELNKRLIGLVSGRIRLSSPQGDREYLTVIGQRDLWRLVTHRRDLLRRKRWVYREDIL